MPIEPDRGTGIMKNEDWLLLGAAAVAAYLLYQNQTAASSAATAGIPVYSSTMTPYSIYPEYGYTAPAQAVTSMASGPAQKATTAPQSYYSVTQQAAQAALFTQCAGSYPGCTPTLGDTQLGL